MSQVIVWTLDRVWLVWSSSLVIMVTLLRKLIWIEDAGQLDYMPVMGSLSTQSSRATQYTIEGHAVHNHATHRRHNED